jgi:radical SAM superfamily enzyme YgiQ (UPF0313 family)
VLLVYPESPNTYWSFKHALRFAGKRAAFPPLGLLTVAALLPASWEKRLVDTNARALRDRDIDWADLVMASAMTCQHRSLHAVIERCQVRRRPIAVGGPIAAKTSALVAHADHLFVGEAEHTLPRFVADFERGEPQRVYHSGVRPDLTATPRPAFELCQLKHYSSLSLQYSRGCPFRCRFCDIPETFGGVPRTKTDRQVLAELQALYDLGGRGPLFIVDDNFVGNRRNVRHLLPALCEWSERNRHPFQFFTDVSIDLADDDELLSHMRRAGFRKVFTGIESPFEDSLKEAGKRQNTRRDLLAAVRKIQGFGIEVMGGFTLGFDHDPQDIFQRQIEFIRDSAIPLAIIHLLTALPDTELWRRLESEGRLLGETGGERVDGSLNFRTTMDRETLIRGYHALLQTIYSPGEYYGRALAALHRSMRSGTAPAGRLTPATLLAFLRILAMLGVRDPARAEFWRFLRRVCVDCRRLLADAMALAASGYHFRRVTEDYCAAAGTRRAAA